MLHWLAQQHDLGPLNALRFLEFRVVLAFLLACAAALACGRPVIAALTRLKVGDMPEFHNQGMNELMKHKASVPTMGGLLIVGATVLACLLAGDLSRVHGFYLWAGLICLLAHAAIGQVDDWMKITYGRRERAAKAAGAAPGRMPSRDGLRTWEKLVFQFGLGVVLSVFLYRHSEFKYLDGHQVDHAMRTCLNLPGLKSWVLQIATDPVTGQEVRNFAPSPALITLGVWAFPLLGTLTIAGMSNAVNLTDGLDGLASGIALIVCGGLAILAFIAGYDHQGTVLAKELLVPHVPDSGELAVLAAAMAGACTGFLWFNVNPASIFMGDTGSLALGGTMGFIAVVIRQEILLFLIGGVFIMEAMSVATQIGVFKLSRGRLGFYDVGDTRRVFLMAPIHHHFQKLVEKKYEGSGMQAVGERKVVGRFWLVTVILVALALATIKLR